MAAQAINILGTQQAHGFVEQLTHPVFATRKGHGAGSQRLGDGLQLLDRQGHDLTWAVTGIEQTLDDAQFFHLRQGVAAFAKAVSSWLGKAIATFPHAQCVLAYARVPLDSGYRKMKVSRLAFAQIHRVIFLKTYCQAHMS